MSNLVKSLRSKYGTKGHSRIRQKDYDDLGGGIKRFVIESKAIDKLRADSRRTGEHDVEGNIRHVAPISHNLAPGDLVTIHDPDGEHLIDGYHGRRARVRAAVPGDNVIVRMADENDNLDDNSETETVPFHILRPAHPDSGRIRRGQHPVTHEESTGEHGPSHLPPAHPDDYKGLKRLVVEKKGFGEGYEELQGAEALSGEYQDSGELFGNHLGELLGDHLESIGHPRDRADLVARAHLASIRAHDASTRADELSGGTEVSKASGSALNASADNMDTGADKWHHNVHASIGRNHNEAARRANFAVSAFRRNGNNKQADAYDEAHKANVEARNQHTIIWESGLNRQ